MTKPPGDGWRLWFCQIYWVGDPDNPYSYRAVEAWRREWQETDVIRPNELDSAFNLAGLYWRPVQRPRLEPECRTAPTE